MARSILPKPVKTIAGILSPDQEEFAELEPVHSWHHEIGDDRIDRRRTEFLEGDFAIPGRFGLVTDAADHFRE